MPQVNPAIMVWARETAGLSQEEAAKKLGFQDSSRSSAVEKLARIERGQKEPSRTQLVNMAGQYRRPLLTFYLSKPPQKSNRGVDFRTLPQGEHSPEEALLDALIREIRARQSMVRVIMEDEDEAVPLPFVGSHRIEDGRTAVLESLKALLNIDATDYRAQRDTSAAFTLLRKRAEEASIFVLLKGNLGNYKTALDTTVFRGFSIADEVTPFIVINDQDAKPAWSFTLLHETVHLLLGHTGISGDSAENEVERFCNDVAGEFLLPARELKQLSLNRSARIGNITERISAFASEFKVSRAMIAYKAYRSDLITRATYNQLKVLYREEWLRNREKHREHTRQNETILNYYRVRRHRLGSRIIGMVRRMMAADALSTSSAAQILGVKPRQVQPLLDTGSSR
ncbi:MAG: ImmA/IrrE family metallo-endopeptidase [Caldilineaceae bacterium SB0665_bin_25]|nr:ImmA/IrrE family metallo-endopeptidase [Caldilineaceae bacterium SB0665_bin_25]